MIDKKIIFFPQNYNQHINFVELADNLVDRGFTNTESIKFLKIQGAFYDDKSDLIIGYEEIKINWVANKSIYRMGLLERLCNIVKNVNCLRCLSFLDDNILVVGNDGAIQRYLNNYFHLFKFYIICDTIIFPQKKIYIVYKIVFDLASKLKLSHFFPGLSFHTQNSGIFVCNENSMSLLKDRGVSSPIYVAEMPVHRKNAKEFELLKSSRTSNGNNVLYITSAYVWHRKLEEDIYQRLDIEDLISHFGNDTSWKVKIRIHPREELANYAWIEKKCSNISISHSIPLVEDLLWCDKLITAMSSVGYESRELGINTYIYRKNFGQLPKSSIYNNGFNIINSLKDLSIDKQSKDYTVSLSEREEIADRLISDCG